MPIFEFECFVCKKKFESIEKIGTNYAYCTECNNIGKRIGMELPAPPKLIAGSGGFYKPSYGDKTVE